MWKDNPVLGVGAGNSNWNIGRYQPRQAGEDGLFAGGEFHARDYTSQSVHSVFFQVLSEMGTVGSLVFGMIVVGHYQGLRALRQRVKRDPRSTRRIRDETEFYVVALGGAMTGYLAAGAFLSVAYYPYPYYFGAFTVAYTRAVQVQLAARTRAATGSAATPENAAAMPPASLASALTRDRGTV
jgi:O-antigen ligase